MVTENIRGIEWYREPRTRRWKWIGQSPTGDIVGGFGTPPALFRKPKGGEFFGELPQDMDAFVQDLLFQGRTPTTEQALREFGATNIDIGEFFQNIPRFDPISGEEAEPFMLPPFEGVRPSEIFARERRDRIQGLLETVFPGRVTGVLEDDLRALEQYISNAPDAFMEDILTLGRTPDTEGLLKAIPWVGAEGERVEITEDDLTELFGAGRAIDGAITEQEAFIEQGIFESFWDAIRLEGRRVISKTFAYFTKTIPHRLYPDVKSDPSLVGKERRRRVAGIAGAPASLVYSPEEAARINAYNQEQRDKWRASYAKEQVNLEEFEKKHPELQPPPRYQQDLMKNLDLLKDPGYIAHLVGSMVPYTAAVMATTFGTLYLTKNPAFAVTAGLAVATPAVSQDLVEDLEAAGVPESLAAEVAIPVGLFIASIEVLSDIFMLKIVAPGLGIFQKAITKEVVGQTSKVIARKGIKEVGRRLLLPPFVETFLDEVPQTITQNVTVSFFDENRDVLENVDETIIKTFITSIILFGLPSAATSLRHVKSDVAETVSPEQKKVEGWELDKFSGEWYKPVKISDTLQENFAKFKEEGLSPELAMWKALNEAARTPEGEKVVQEAYDKVAKEEPVVPEVPKPIIRAPGQGDFNSGDTFTTPEGEVRLNAFSTIDNTWNVILPDGTSTNLTVPQMNENLATGDWKFKKPEVTAPARVEPIVHRGTEPEGIAIGDAVGVRYDGIQKELGMQFTDVTETGSTYYAQTEAEARTKLVDMRRAFAKPPAVEKPVVEEAPKLEIIGEGGVPVDPNEPIAQGIVDNIPLIQDIGLKERIARPSRKVFERMGLFEEILGVQEAEVLVGEARKATLKKVKELEKSVGKNKERWSFIADEVDKPGSVTGLTFQEKRVVNWIRNWADEWAKVKNLPESQRIKDYLPHLFEKEMREQLEQTGQIPAELATLLDDKITRKITDPFLKQRLGAVGWIKDPFRAIIAYEAAANRVLYYEPLLQKVAVVANDPSTPLVAREYLKDFSRRMTGELHSWDIASNNTLKELAGMLKKIPGTGPMVRFLTQGNPSGMISYSLTSLYYPLWLGFKATSAIRNLSQNTLTLAEVGPVAFAKGMALLAKPSASYSSARKASVNLRGRKLGRPVPGLEESFRQRWIEPVFRVSMAMFSGADKVNINVAFASGFAESQDFLTAHNESLPADKKVSPERLQWYHMKRGDEVLADTQYLYTKMNSMAVSQSAIGRVFSVLTTWAVNFTELITKWALRRPSQVFQLYERETGSKLPKKNFSQTYKAIITYMLIVALGYALKERERIKAWEYTGITSFRYLANIFSGELPGLEIPGAAAKITAGFVTDDERMLKQGWNDLTRTLTPSVWKQIESVANGDKDWLTLFFYLEGKDWKIKKLKNSWEKGWKEYDALPPKDRNDYRENNPLLEAQMFIASKLTTLSSDKARAEVLRLIEEHDIDTEMIKGYEKVFGVDTDKELTEKKNLLGTVELEDGEQKLKANGELDYFTTSNLASEFNKQEKLVGRFKIEQDGNALAIEYLRAKDLWVPYDDLTDEAARVLYRQQFPDVEAQLYLWGKISTFKNPKSAGILLKLMDKYNIPPEAVPAFLDNPEKYDELFTREFELEQKWFESSAEYDSLETGEERDKFKEDNPKWVAGMKRIEAIDRGIVAEDTYVDWYTNPDIKRPKEHEGDWYEDDWYLQEHSDFYQEMLDKGIWKPRNFDKVPTREVFELYKTWQLKDLGNARRDMEARYPELDKWLHDKFGTKLETER